METLFLACMFGGVIFAIVSVLFGDLIGQAFDGMLDFLSADSHSWFEPMTLVGGITIFGGAGLMLTRYTGLGEWIVLLLALLIAVVGAISVLFLYVRPMKNSENSIAFSLASLAGALGEVITPVPANGYGEVLVKVGAGNTNQIAASFDGEEIGSGAKVVVVEVKDHTLYVSKVQFTND